MGGDAVSKTSPTKRTMDWCEMMGWRAQVVEHYNAFSHRKLDLFNILDILALDTESREVVGIQVTSDAHHAERRTKILESEAYPDLKDCDVRIEVHSWGKKGPRGQAKKWTLRREIL